MRVAFVCLGQGPGTAAELLQPTRSTAGALTADHEVTMIVASPRGADGDSLTSQADHPGLTTVAVDLPEDRGSFTALAHRRSAVALDALRSVYGAQGPDYVEFADRGGEGAVTIQARRARDPFLARTRIGVRAWGTDEMLRVLDGFLPDEAEPNLLHELERTTLRHADVRLVPADAVERTYAAFYPDRDALARSVTLRPVVATIGAGKLPKGRPPLAGRPLRLLYAAPLDPRRGPQAIVEALLGLDRPPNAWQLTICGDDRAAGALGTSFLAQLQLTAGDDARISFADPASDLGELLADHDVLVLPTRWECWPAVGIQALLANRPLLATPVGGLHELARPGQSGWLADDSSPAAIGRAVEQLLDDPRQLDALVAAAAPRTHGSGLSDARAVSSAYAELFAAVPAARPSPPRRRTPLVSVVIPYFRLPAYVERAIASAYAQTYPRIEVIVVDDGSGEPADAILDELAERWPLTLLTQPNQGVGAARNFGIAQASGRYVVPLDADNELDPRFVARAVEVLEAEPEVAYACTWSTFVDEAGTALGVGTGFQPVGGRGPEFDRRNIAGDAVALIRRRLFEQGFRYRPDLASMEDWMLYRELNDAGHHGAVIPERLFSYRVRESSKYRTMGLPHMQRLAGELQARQREGSVTWT